MDLKMTSALPPPGWYPDPSGEPAQRYFDGRDWTEDRAWPLSDQQRTALLDAAVAWEVGRSVGIAVAMRTPHQAVLHYRGSGGLSGAARIVFALFTIFTCGLFGIIWFVTWLASSVGAGERQVSLWVDPYGHIVKG